VKLGISGLYFGFAGRFHLIPTEDSLLHAFWKAGKATLDAEKLQISHWVEKKEKHGEINEPAKIVRSTAIIEQVSSPKVVD
jgi:hypothetical protein